MLCEPCRLSKPISERRKGIRRKIFAMQRDWNAYHHDSLSLAEEFFCGFVRMGHLLRMDGLPAAFPDGRPLPRLFGGRPTQRKPKKANGARRRPI